MLQSCGAFILVEGDGGAGGGTQKNSKHANVFKSGGDKDIKRMKIGLCCLEVVEVSSKSCIRARASHWRWGWGGALY